VEAHRARGTFREHRHAPVVDLRPPSTPAPPPQSLNPASQELWSRLVAEYQGWAPHELCFLELALASADRAADYGDRIKREGLMPKGKPHPLLRAQRAAEQFMLDVFRQLRLGR
jgi:hypothetical protein